MAYPFAHEIEQCELCIVILPPPPRYVGGAQLSVPLFGVIWSIFLGMLLRFERPQVCNQRATPPPLPWIEFCRKDRVAEEARNIANGNPGDVDFMGMIQSFRDQRWEEKAPTPNMRGGLRVGGSLLPHAAYR